MSSFLTDPYIIALLEEIAYECREVTAALELIQEENEFQIQTA